MPAVDDADPFDDVDGSLVRASRSRLPSALLLRANVSARRFGVDQSSEPLL